MSKIIIGGEAICRKIVTFSLSKQQYDKFKDFCTANNYEYRLPFEKENGKEIVVCCVEAVIRKFQKGKI